MFELLKAIHSSLNELYHFLKKLNKKDLFISILFSSFFAGIFLGLFSFFERTISYGWSLSVFNKVKALCFSTGLLGIAGLLLGVILFIIVYSLIFLYLKLCELSRKGETIQAYKVLVLYSIFWAAVATYLFVHFIIENPSDALVDIFRMNDILTGGIYVLYIILALVILILIIVFLKNALNKKVETKTSPVKPVFIKIAIILLAILAIYYLLSISTNSWQVNQWLNSKFVVSYNSFWVDFLNAYSNNLILFKVNLFISLCALFIVINYLFVFIAGYILKLRASSLYISIFTGILAFITYFIGQNFLTNQLFLRFQITLLIILVAASSFIFFIITTFCLNIFLKYRYNNILFNKKTINYFIIGYTLICIIGLWGYNSSNTVKAHICRYYTTERLVLYGHKLFDGNVFTSLVPSKFTHLNESKKDLSALKQSLKTSPNIILIVIDALRKDVVEENLNKPGNVIGEFTKQAYNFENFYSHATYTVGSISSLFSSKMFAVRSDLDYLTLAEILCENGYYTYAANTFVKEFNFDYITLNKTRHNALFSRGFNKIDKVRFSMKEAKSLKDENVTRIFNRFLKDYDYKKPVFAYIHFTEMHSIQPSIVFKNVFNGKQFYKTYNRIYQSENENLSKLMNVLKTHNMYHNSIIIITTDHGEAAKDHGNLFHVNSVYQELVHIPFYIKLPGQTKPETVKQSFSLLDLMPTILDYTGYDYSNLSFDGRSFSLILNNKKTPLKNIVLAEYVYKYPLAFEYGLYGNDDMYDKAIFEVGIIDENAEWKVIKNYYYDFIELYNLKNDPAEKNNLIDEQQQIAEQLLQKYNNPFFYKNN